jgi:N-carbamoyl-L-amino-acid hydrolase
VTVFNDDDKQLAEKIFEHIRIESAAPGGGVTRPSYSDAETRAVQVIIEYAERLKLFSAFDDVANLVFTTTPLRPKKACWLGSHLDSVPNGGNYDGLAGVVAALLVLAKAKALDVQVPLVGVGLRGEESAWFGIPHIGAKAMLGQLKPFMLDRSRSMGPHLSLGACMGATGADLEAVHLERPIVNPAEISAWWELHIEQGPMLVSHDVPVGIVTDISGSVRTPAAKMRGQAGHSGTTPHANREDAVMRFVDLMGAIESRRSALMMEHHELRVTCGMVSTNPQHHSMTSIADEVTFSLDVRGNDLTLMADLYTFAQMYAGDALELGELISTKPCKLSPETVLAATVATRDLGIKHIALTSGAGHDATVFASQGVHTGMIFVRNHNGSHNPAEAMALDDFMAGLEVLWRVVTC